MNLEIANHETRRATKKNHMINHMMFMGIVLLFSFSVQSEEDNLNPYRHWKNVKYSISDVLESESIKNHCYKEIKNLFGCVQMVNTLGQFLKPQLSLIPINLYAEFQKEKRYGAVKKNLSSFLLVENSQENTKKEYETVREYVQDKKNNYNRVWTALTELKSQNRPAMDFVGLIIDLKKEIQNKDDQGFEVPEGYIAAAMYNALLHELFDPHTGLISKEEMEDAEKNPGTHFVGIGIEVGYIKKHVVIQRTYEQGPAARAGLLAEDIIVEVDGENVSNKSLNEVIQKIRGKSGVKVILTVLRDNEKVTLEVVRAPISTPNVSYKIVDDIAGRMGYIKLNSFVDPSACERVSEAMEKLQDENATSLIFDLRNNGGGRVDVAACIGGLFVGMYKDIAKIYDYNAIYPKAFQGTRPQQTQLPVVVLVNERSASASELLSGALQDYQRAWVVGERTYGKGTSQMIRPFQSDSNLLIKITTNRFYLPSGRTNQLVGILPDFEAPAKPDLSEVERQAEREEDHFNVLPSGEKWSQTRPQLVERISSCLRSGEQAQRIYFERKPQKKNPDYQLLAAQEVLYCSGVVERSTPPVRVGPPKNGYMSNFGTVWVPIYSKW